MTVIAWDGKTLAADKRACIGTMISTVTKIQRIGNLLVGGAGDFGYVLAMFDWIKKGRRALSFPDDQRSADNWQLVIVIEVDGTASIYERTPFPVRYEQTFVAIGSGREFARAALYMGATAAEAVSVACALDNGCGNGIDTLELRQ